MESVGSTSLRSNESITEGIIIMSADRPHARGTGINADAKDVNLPMSVHVVWQRQPGHLGCG